MSFSDGWASFGKFMNDPANLLGGKQAEDAARQQLAAQNQAKEDNLALVQQGRLQNESYLGQSTGAINAGTNAAQGALGVAYGQQQGYYGQAAGAINDAAAAAQNNYNQGAAALYGGQTNQLAALGSGYNQARGDLGQLAGLAQYGQGATSAVGSGANTAAAMASIGQPVNLQADPGYQFRQQQGEQAINRAASAAGGRLSGKTLSALADYNSGLASQEYQNAYNRQYQNNAQQLQAAGSLDSMSLQSGLAAQQNQYGLAQTGYGAQSQLANLAYSQGQNQANVYGNTANSLAGLRGDQAALSANAGGQLANIYGNQAGAAMQYGAGQAGIAQERGNNLASLYSGAAQQNIDLNRDAMNVNANAAGYQGMVDQATANGMKSNGQLAGSILGTIFGKGGGGGGGQSRSDGFGQSWADYGNRYYR